MTRLNLKKTPINVNILVATDSPEACDNQHTYVTSGAAVDDLKHVRLINKQTNKQTFVAVLVLLGVLFLLKPWFGGKWKIMEGGMKDCWIEIVIRSK